MSLPDHFRAMFTDERRFWRLLTLVLGGFAILKGFRPPNYWALSLSQIDYSHGFVKRGLYGTILPIHQHQLLTLVYLLILAAFFAALARLTVLARLQARFGSLALAALFFSSYAVSFLTQLIGAADLLTGLLCVLLLLIRSPHFRFAAALVGVPAALLIHENFLFLFLPTLLFSFCLDAHSAPRTRLLAYPALLGALALALTLATSLHPNLSPAQASSLLAGATARADFPVEPQVFQILTRGLRDNLRFTHAYSPFVYWSFFLIGVSNLLPAWLLLHQHIRRLARPHRGLYPLALLAIALPALMFPLGTDSVRWLVLIFLATYLTLLQLSRGLPLVPAPASLVERNLILFLLTINMITGNGFFDGFRGAFFPFFPRLLH